MKSYLLAKYVDDLTRNEPSNIGVIVYDGSRALARFDGEDDNEKIDLRRVRHRITGSRSYRAWIEYWRRVLTEPAVLDRSLRDTAPGDPGVIDRLLGLAGRDFYLEPGGTILFDADADDLQATVDDLFKRLVKADEPPAPRSLREKSRDALAAAGVALGDQARFKERVPRTVERKGVTVEEEVSYAVMNGSWHYLQEVSFDSGNPVRSRKEASHCAFLFEHALQDEGGLILYDDTDVSEPILPLVDLLSTFAPIVDVDDRDAAAGLIQDKIGVSALHAS